MPDKNKAMTADRDAAEGVRTANDLIESLLGRHVEMDRHTKALAAIWAYRDQHTAAACAPLREALEKCEKAFKHWAGGGTTSGHYWELREAKEAMARALQRTAQERQE
jgi:hypothetical protein